MYTGKPTRKGEPATTFADKNNTVEINTNLIFHRCAKIFAKMPTSNKDRIYIALYARGGQEPGTYHWAIIVGPKIEAKGTQGRRFHVKQRLDPAGNGQFVWIYESLEIPLVPTGMLLGRITIGKVTDKARLHSTLSAVPVLQNDPSWTCRIWVRGAIAALEADGRCLGTSVTSWEKIEKVAKEYIEKKRLQRRYDGSGSWSLETVPTFSLLEDREVIP